MNHSWDNVHVAYDNWAQYNEPIYIRVSSIERFSGRERNVARGKMNSKSCDGALRSHRIYYPTNRKVRMGQVTMIMRKMRPETPPVTIDEADGTILSPRNRIGPQTA